MAACKSCGATIEWAVDPKDKRIPVDPGTQHNGNLAVRAISPGSLIVRYLKKGDNPAPDERRAVSHYATCPHAKQWRERGTKA